MNANEVCIVPPTQSSTQGNKFALSFDRIANTIFQCTSTSIPGVSLPPKEQPTPFVNLHVPGNKIEFAPLEVDFIIDNQYNSWYDIFIWLMGEGFPESFQQYADLAKNSVRRPGFPPTTGVRPAYSDATVIIFTNKNNPQIRMQFFDCFPTELSTVHIGYDMDANQILKAKATFFYSYYTFSRI